MKTSFGEVSKIVVTWNSDYNKSNKTKIMQCQPVKYSGSLQRSNELN